MMKEITIISRHRIVSASAPGMASSYALNGKPSAFERAIFGDSFHCILAASGCVATARRKERRNALSVELYEQYEQCGEQMFHNTKLIDAYSRQ